MAKTARGCPSCGSHATWGLGKSGMQQCDECRYRWQPCDDQFCRGYKVFTEPSPGFVGCSDCDKDRGGVRADIVQWWPEVWRAIARKLDERERDKQKSSGYPAKPSSSLVEPAHGKL